VPLFSVVWLLVLSLRSKPLKIHFVAECLQLLLLTARRASRARGLLVASSQR